jgi:ABC-type multidrug transport system fused ATPase/permease subunit
MTLPLEEEEGKRLPLEGPITSIRFDHVSFSYPNASHEVLKDVTFEIKQGEKVSIVGLNGAGKTTLIKLLCRLYAPSQGTIYVNGIDLNDYDRRQYLAKLSVVFQDYRLFEYPIQDNIVGSETYDEQRLHETVQQVSLSKTLADLPLGLQTPMDKDINELGVELSGGQQQKVAIARALYKESSLVILDEPTSALDPLAEAEIYEHFNHLVHDRTAIYISHRMSSSVFCDRVLIIDGGSVADYDTHANLMKKKGSLYYRMFQSQADNYRL